MKSLYLTADEKKIFDTLDPGLTKGVPVEAETLTFEDTDEKRQVRMSNLTLSHPALRKLQEDAKTKKFSKEEIAALAQSVNLADLSQDDMIELAFAWGPSVFSVMIFTSLAGAQSVQEFDGLSDLCNTRHGLLLALNRTMA